MKLQTCPKCSGISGLSDTCSLCEGSKEVTLTEIERQKQIDRRNDEFAEQQWQEYGR